MTGDAAARRVTARFGLRVDGPARARLARAAGSGDDDDALVDALTVQESRFFRDPESFTVLRRRLKDEPRPGVIWSAGCGNGEEPWSIAMLLEEAGLEGWQVLATDISRAARERTVLGRYSERELRGLSPERRQRFLVRDDDTWRIAPALRDRVRVEAHHLLAAPPPGAGGCRIVFWRNVLIYLVPEAAERALRILRAHMPPDGVLFLGAGEALTPGAGGFLPERRGGVYVYRPRADGAREHLELPPPSRRPADPAPPPGPDTRRNLALARERMRPQD